jgi:hypothetical protein
VTITDLKREIREAGILVDSGDPVLEFHDFQELKDSGVFDDPNVESADDYIDYEDGVEGTHFEHDAKSVGQWGLRVRALRDWIINMVLSYLWTTTVRTVKLESEPGQYAIAGGPEELVRTFQQRPALFHAKVLEGIKAWEAEYAKFLFGRPWRTRAIKHRPACVYPSGITEKSLIVDEDGMVLSIVGVPGYEDVRLDSTGLLKHPGIVFRWMSPNTIVDSWGEYHVYWLRFRTMTVKRMVKVGDVDKFTLRMKRVRKWLRKRGKKLRLVPWYFSKTCTACGTQNTFYVSQCTCKKRKFEAPRWEAWTGGEMPDHMTRCRVEWHWRLASHPKVVEDEALGQLRDKLAEYEDLMTIQSLDPVTGEMCKVGTAYDANIDPELPFELNPTGGSVPTMCTLDPYDVHMYKTQEKYTLRENTEPRIQFHCYGGASKTEVMWRLKYRFWDLDEETGTLTHTFSAVEPTTQEVFTPQSAPPKVHPNDSFRPSWHDSWDFTYPEHDVDDIMPGGGFWPTEGEWDPGSVPSVSYYVRDLEISDKLLVNISRVHLRHEKGEWHLGDNPDEKSKITRWWYRWALCWKWDIHLDHLVIERKKWVTKAGSSPWRITKAKWKTDKKHYALSWPKFHNALAWLVRHKEARITGIEYDRRLDTRTYVKDGILVKRNPKVFYKPAGVNHHPELPGEMPKWAVDQELWINTDSEGMATKARVFGVPSHAPDCDRLMKGKPLAVYQVGFVTWDKTEKSGDVTPSRTIWRLSRDERPVQRYWLNVEIPLTEKLCWEIGLSPEVADLVNPVLRLNIMNELAARVMVNQKLRGYERPKLNPVVERGVPIGGSGLATVKAGLPERNHVDLEAIKPITREQALENMRGPEPKTKRPEYLHAKQCRNWGDAYLGEERDEYRLEVYRRRALLRGSNGREG